MALAFIAGTHAVIDHYRLARYLCWAKNFMAPPQTEEWDTVVGLQLPGVKTWWHPWSECSGTGYHKDKPAWLTVWLMFITDNILHVLCNGLAIYLWGS